MLPHFLDTYFSFFHVCNMKKYFAIVRYKNLKIKGNLPNSTHNRNLKLCTSSFAKKGKLLKKTPLLLSCLLRKKGKKR